MSDYESERGMVDLLRESGWKRPTYEGLTNAQKSGTVEVWPISAAEETGGK